MTTLLPNPLPHRLHDKILPENHSDPSDNHPSYHHPNRFAGSQPINSEVRRCLAVQDLGLFSFSFSFGPHHLDLQNLTSSFRCFASVFQLLHCLVGLARFSQSY